MDVDGAVLNPEICVLTEFETESGGGVVAESPNGEAFFGVGPVPGNGIDLMLGIFSPR